MKRFWVACGLLALILAGTLGSAWYLNRVVSGYESRLTAAQEMAERGAWESAGQLTGQVHRDWELCSFYFHVLLRHTDTDQVMLSFREVQEYLKLEEMDQYAAANARLIAQLRLLGEMEQLTLENIL